MTSWLSTLRLRVRGSEQPFASRQVMRRPVAIISVTLVVILLGLASRKFREYLPAFLGEYAGDTLWALVLYLLVILLTPSRRIVVRATIALAIAFLVEFSQLYHANWIDGIRATTLGGLVLGFGFLWTDLICYAVGIAAGATMEHWLIVVSKRNGRIN